MPEFEGRDSFQGRLYHTGQWPKEGVDFAGQRVGVIGTGSSAIQAIPQIARQAAHLYVFQRTPNFSVPAMNRMLDPAYVADFKARYPEVRARARSMPAGIAGMAMPERSALEDSPEERQQQVRGGLGQGGDGVHPHLQGPVDRCTRQRDAAEFVRAKIRSIVKDPAVAEKLAPRDHPIGTKRICLDTDYFETYNRDNVTLVDVRSAPIESINARGVRTATGEFPLDAIVFATGFDAMTGPLLAIDMRTGAGATLPKSGPQDRAPIWA
jgi:cyclohexanone monooxygenase